MSDGGIELGRDLAFLEEGNVKIAGFAESNIDWTLTSTTSRFSECSANESTATSH